MSNAQYQTGKLTAVYHPMGTFDDGRSRLKRANFDVLEWASTSGGSVDRYILPLGNRYDSHDFADIERTAGSDATDVAHEFGYYQTKYMLVEPHEMGNFNDGTIWAVHRFDYL